MSFWKQALLTLVLVAAVAGGWYYYGGTSAPESGRQGAGGASARSGGGGRVPGLVRGGAVNVVTAPVEVDRVGETVTALGTAKAARSVMLFPQVSAVVADIMLKPGETVKAGTPLVRLEDDEEQANADRARIQYAQAQAALKRSQSLAQSKTISDVALSDAEMATQLAENQVRIAEIAVSRRLITAPIDGVVGLSDISVGDLVTTSTEITTLEDLSTIRVGFEVPERWSADVAQGQAISASAQALPGSQFGGTITGIDNHVDETTRTLKLEAELANHDGLLKAGMAVVVKLGFDASDALTVPSIAVQWDRRGSYVWKIAEGAARRADVAIVRRESGIVIVKGDVAAGDKVVVEGLMRLRDGAKVTEVDEAPEIVEESSPAAEAPAEIGVAAPERSRS